MHVCRKAQGYVCVCVCVCVCVHTAEVSGEGPSAGDKEVSVQ